MFYSSKMQKFLVLCLAVAILFDIALAEPRTAYGGGYGRVFGRGIGNRWYNDNIGGSGGGGGGGGGRGGGGGGGGGGKK